MIGKTGTIEVENGNTNQSVIQKAKSGNLLVVIINYPTSSPN